MATSEPTDGTYGGKPRQRDVVEPKMDVVVDQPGQTEKTVPPPQFDPHPGNPFGEEVSSWE